MDKAVYQRVDRICPQCSKAFSVPPSTARQGKGVFCSLDCLRANQANRKITRTCETCGKSFTFPRWELNERHAKRFCSKACEGVAKRSEPEGSFWSYVDKSGGEDACWIWTGRRYSGGYGRFTNPGGPEQAHRIAWEMTNGPIPKGRFACHTCDNPICVNPAHLWVGTNADNMRDMWQKGRHNGPLGQRHPQSKLSDEAVAAIRARRTAGEPLKTLAAEFDVSMALVSQIARGKARKHT